MGGKSRYPGLKTPCAADLVRRAAGRVFKKLECRRLAVEVCAIDREQAAALNMRYRNKRKPAEILAFPLPSVSPGGSIGQICICPRIAYRRAANLGKKRTAWIQELAIHAALHVLGFSHRTPGAAREMFSLQRSLVRCR